MYGWIQGYPLLPYPHTMSRWIHGNPAPTPLSTHNVQLDSGISPTPLSPHNVLLDSGISLSPLSRHNVRLDSGIFPNPLSPYNVRLDSGISSAPSSPQNVLMDSGISPTSYLHTISHWIQGYSYPPHSFSHSYDRLIHQQSRPLFIWFIVAFSRNSVAPICKTESFGFWQFCTAQLSSQAIVTLMCKNTKT